ncbi:substrate-binding domain-containing protein [Maribius pontilimi]|uniref:Substrate-binding domain-containing protein n=1 Tax=Palleronia pontilimi TaxID=1964209 RepID=A0A934IG76_9RHOB|nr:substrate-binding domain-containing protein [Palleronia pontilimi]MBJ3763807.1 substrate-binding domain-containing protein [Palleronia pontilimi]
MISYAKTAAGALVSGLVLMGGPQAATAQDNDYTICFVTFSLQIEYFQQSVEGGERAAEDLGVELIVFDPQADATRQVTLVEDCIARQVDAIVVDPIESNSLMGPIEQAAEAGIPMVTLDTPIDHPNVLSLIGVEQYATSREFGRYVAGIIAAKMDGAAKVGLMIASSEVQIARRDGFVDAIQAVLPDVEIVAEGDGRNILERATSEAENMLTANPEINVIYATGDPQLQGALAAGLSQNRDIAFFGWDDVPDYFIPPLQEGRLQGFLMQSPDFNGEQGVRLLVDHLNGEDIPARVSYIPTIVTPFNLEQVNQ